jgi:hypothetical protein
MTRNEGHTEYKLRSLGAPWWTTRTRQGRDSSGATVDFRVDYRFTSHIHYYHFTIAATNNCDARCSTVLFWDDDYR